MRCLLVLIGLHAVWTMMDAQRERGHFYGIKSVTSSIKGLAGMLLGGLCCACLLFRSKDTLMYHGLAGVRAYFADKVTLTDHTHTLKAATATPRAKQRPLRPKAPSVASLHCSTLASAGDTPSSNSDLVSALCRRGSGLSMRGRRLLCTRLLDLC